MSGHGRCKSLVRRGIIPKTRLAFLGLQCPFWLQNCPHVDTSCVVKAWNPSRSPLLQLWFAWACELATAVLTTVMPSVVPVSETTPVHWRVKLSVPWHDMTDDRLAWWLNEQHATACTPRDAVTSRVTINTVAQKQWRRQEGPRAPGPKSINET